MFSPYYAWRGHRDPLDHCAVNVALYGSGKNRWAMTERGREHVGRADDVLQIGPSSLTWKEGCLEIRLDEVCAPLPRRIRGTITVKPLVMPEELFVLDTQGRHLWQPIAPLASVEVKLDRPELAWRGTGYFDSNRGAEPIADGFQAWTWSRLARRNRCIVLYDAKRRDGTDLALALRTGADGRLHAIAAPALSQLPSSRWGLSQQTRTDPGTKATIHRRLEDTPFYARNFIETHIHGERLEGFHECLALDRFASPLIRAMLPFRMPRRVF